MHSSRLFNSALPVNMTVQNSSFQLISKLKDILAKKTAKTSFSTREQESSLLAKNQNLVRPKILWCENCGEKLVKLTSLSQLDLQCGQCSSSLSWTFLPKKAI